MIFNLQSGYEYIQLNQLLKLLNLVETGGEANQVIVDGEVFVNNVQEDRKRMKLFPGDIVEFRGQTIEIQAELED